MRSTGDAAAEECASVDRALCTRREGKSSSRGTQTGYDVHRCEGEANSRSYFKYLFSGEESVYIK